MKDKMPLSELMGAFLHCLNKVSEQAGSEQAAKAQNLAAGRANDLFGQPGVSPLFIDVSEWSFALDLQQAAPDGAWPDAAFSQEASPADPAPGSTGIRMSIRWKKDRE